MPHPGIDSTHFAFLRSYILILSNKLIISESVGRVALYAPPTTLKHLFYKSALIVLSL